MGEPDGYSYYDIDDILADAEPIPVVFSTDAVDLGHLDEQGSDSTVLKKNTRVELPMWLASQLLVNGYVSMELPRVFCPAFREMIMADPVVVDLQQRCAYYYEFGIKLANLISMADLGVVLCAALDARYKEIVRRTPNRKQIESLEFMSKLSNLERQLFDAKQAGLIQLRKLHDRSSVQLSIAPVFATLQEFQSLLGVSSGGASAAQRRAAELREQQQRGNGNNGGALRNITDGVTGSRNSGAGSASDRRGAGGAASSSAASGPSKPSGAGAGTGTGTQALLARGAASTTSTLAHLQAVAASNQPLASHQQKRYGMAATQARDTQQRSVAQAHGAQREALAQAAATQSGRQTAETARKRKITQNK